MAMSRQCRLGFTIVELLVVITVIGILVGLLVPAVNAARESARRSTCRNNLKELGGAAQQHVAQYQFYPSAGWGGKWMGDPDMGVGAKQPGSWLYSLTPFLGLNTVHDPILVQGGTRIAAKGADINTKKNAMQVTFNAAQASFICPTRRRVRDYPVSPDSNEAPLNCVVPTGSAKTDYAANAGSPPSRQTTNGPGSLECLKTYPNCTNSDSVPWDTNSDSYRSFNGVCYRRSEVALAHLKDGTSQTIFAAEKYMNSLQYNTGLAGSDRKSCYQGYSTDTIRFVPIPNSPDIGRKPTMDMKEPAENLSGGLHSQCFGAAHPAGFNAVFCDGSVHQLSYGMELAVFGQLGTRDDVTRLNMPPVDVSAL